MTKEKYVSTETHVKITGYLADKILKMAEVIDGFYSLLYSIFTENIPCLTDNERKELNMLIEARRKLQKENGG